MPNTHSRSRKDHRRRGAGSKLPEWTKRLNASQRGLLTKFTKTGERDMRNRVTEERPLRRAAWERRKAEAKQKNTEAA
jgi:hypothetical protein